MPADGNGIPRRGPHSNPPSGSGHHANSWLDRRAPGPVSARRPRIDPAEEAMSHNPNLSPPIHFDRPR